MGWFDWWSKNDDPLSDLDPSLRSYLEKEAPKRYRANTNASPSEVSYRQQLGIEDPVGSVVQQRQQELAREAAKAKASANGDDDDRPLPKESLFQDGRYKHIWKTYRPLQEVEAAGKSDQEKLSDIVAGFRERQAEVKQAAMANCADEQWWVTDCFLNGSWASRMSMCRAENRQFTRCINMQSRFLRALGYVSLVERSDEETEKIQMHADRLYHRMLDHEKAVDEAKQNGLPIPKLPSVTEGDMPKPAMRSHEKAPPISYDTLPKHLQEKINQTRLAGLEGMELEMARRELDYDLAINQDMVIRLAERWHTENRERLAREAKGEQRFGDYVKKYFDFRKYSEDPSTADGNSTEDSTRS